MESYSQRGEKRRSSSEFGDDDLGSDENSTNTSNGNQGKSPGNGKGNAENDKRLRREIANSNERRRMQSINAGFQSLKTLLPHHDGEKLSKAAILQQTTEYINAVDSEKSRLQTQNEQLKRMIAELSRENEQRTSPPPKRKKRDTEGSDEGIGGMSAGESDDQTLDELRAELMNLRAQLDRERHLRMALEERNRELQARLYPTPTMNHAQQPQMRYQNHKPQMAVEFNEDMRGKVAEPEPHVTPVQHHQPVSAVPPGPVLSAVKPEPSPPGLTSIPQPRAHIPSVNPAATSMSRRNLETIVEAIRHLEGESALFDSFKKPAESNNHNNNNGSSNRDIPPHSEGESEKESSMYSDEEMKSESSGRDSPPLFKPHHTTATATVQVREAAIPVHVNVNTAAAHVTAAPPFVSSEIRYPIATQLLHRPTTLQQPFAVHRPGVIVQNLS